MFELDKYENGNNKKEGKYVNILRFTVLQYVHVIMFFLFYRHC